MADKKISGMTELTSLATGDLIPVVDVSDTTDAATGTNKKTLLSTITDYIASLTQTFTNKTITSTTNNVTAKSLHSATTVVDVSAATAPSSGQVLTATSSTAATWQSPSASSDISCRVTQNVGTSLSTTWTAIAFNLETFDTDTMHDNVTNNTRITFKTAGKYMVGGGWYGTTNTVTGIRIRLNGTTVIATAVDGNAGTNLEYNSIATLYTFAVNDYIELQGYSNSIQNTTGDSDTYFWAAKV